ncbi:MAG TPA: tetratricopeptide repeat protein [Longimicrobiaceae bacterium]|nr:tetratricopeptide repeat protein [Longimicrobiaceae bacterium]
MPRSPSSRLSLKLLLAGLSLLAAAPLGAQREGSVHWQPPRPRLPAGADTADAQVYYSYGLQVVEEQPRRAAAAFYWATRIRPGWADALYARHAALVAGYGDLYTLGRRGRRPPEVLALDTLFLRALTLDPFLYRKLERQLLIRMVTFSDESDVAGAYRLDTFLRSAAPELRAMNAYGKGEFEEAARHLEEAVRGARKKSRLRAELARVLYLSGDRARALEVMRQAVAEAHTEDEDEDNPIVYYESKALLEQSIGHLLELGGDLAGAREAYGRALQEDLAYYPAHARLARLSLATGDTAAALAEMDLAVQLDPASGYLRFSYAVMLVQARKYLEAGEQLTKAIELEPWFAAPYLLLGKLYDGSNSPAEALDYYRRFLERASRSHSDRAWTTQRIGQLEAAPPAAAPPPEDPR